MRHRRHVFSGKYCLIYMRKNEIGWSRFAFSIQKTTGKAHYRNWVKRILREYLRLNVLPLGYPVDFLIVIRSRLRHRVEILQDMGNFITYLKNGFEH